MATIDVINQTGAVVGSMELNDAVFGIEPNQQSLFDALGNAAGKSSSGNS